MDPHTAADNLQVIRTLMERAAIYRRALAPILLLAGVVGTAAAAVGLLWPIHTLRAFILFWIAASLVPVAGALLISRQQALHAHEPFWSPPARRVLSAMLPALCAGLAIAAAGFQSTEGTAGADLLRNAVLGWILLFGCGLHAAGFFTLRGVRWLGWGFVLGGSGLWVAGVPRTAHEAHVVMGFVFGLLNLGCGLYLRWSEKGEAAG